MKKFTLRSGNKPKFKMMGSSPMKAHDGTKSTTTHYKDGSPKSKREIDFSKQHEQEIAKEANKKKSNNYQKRKEELLNQGFSQVEADQMIKEGGVTGDVEIKPKRKKKSNKKKFGEIAQKSPAKQGEIFDPNDPKQMEALQKIPKSKKTYPKSYTKKDIEFLKKQREDIVRYEDLDEKGKAIWRKQGKPVPKAKKKSPAKDVGHKTKLPVGHGHETEEDIRKYGYDTVYAKRIAENRAKKRKKHHAKYK